MAATYYRRTKIIKNGKVVGYRYPNAASRRYYEAKYGKKTTTKKKTPIKTGGNTGKEQGRQYPVQGHRYETDVQNNPKGKGVTPKTPKTPKPIDTTPPKHKEPTNKAYGLFKASKGRQRDGGPSAQALANANGNASFNRQMNFNLSNDEDRAQGSEHDWAIPTSISHLISGQLRQAAHSQEDAFFSLGVGSKVAASNPLGAFGTTAVMRDLGNIEAEQAEEMEEYMGDEEMLGGRGTTYYDSSGKQISYEQWMANRAAAEKARMDKIAAEGNKFPTLFGGWSNGGFKNQADADRWMYYDKAGYNKAFDDAEAAYNRIMDPLWEMDNVSDAAWEDAERKAEAARNKTYMSAYANFYNNKVGTNATQMYYDESKGHTVWQQPRSPSTGTGGQTGPVPLPNAPVDQGGPTDDDIFGEAANQYYNPWSRLQGGATNSYGPSAEQLNQSTLQAMSLANAYFAPQRAELAYELGDMEIDMKRMAVNLGRQIDDPILQAKLYKEASRAVRTLDIQQNTLAFQMADQRRKEDIANFQFYDQLAAQEAQLKLANRQFYDKFNLDKRYYNLENWNAQQYVNMNQQAPSNKSGAEESQVTYGNLLNGYKGY